MDNLYLFHLINAGPGLAGLQLLMARGVANGLIYFVPLGMIWGWWRGDQNQRIELLTMLFSVAISLLIAQVVTLVWPQPRPFALHAGTQFLAHSNDPGLPSDHVTVFWGLALAALCTRRFGVWALPMFAAGLLVGWTRVYLGVHFPFDILAALPVAAAGTSIAWLLKGKLMPFFIAVLRLHDRIVKSIELRLHKQFSPADPDSE
jgi:undecaprenyl-diphosphatase